MKTTITIDWTLVIALYGAITATITIIWDVWKYKHAGPDVHVHERRERDEGQAGQEPQGRSRGDPRIPDKVLY